ncbi:MAG: pyridoxamine 5'-phosphate oxidase family protein [Litorilinea sp.]
MSTPDQDEILARLWQKLEAAPACWLSSVRPDGRAHTAPIWHVWHAHTIYVVTQAQSVRAHNIAHNPAVTVALPDPMNVFIVEGVAHPTPYARDALRPLFQNKYEWDIGSEKAYGLILGIAPRKALAWGDHGEGRWHFDLAAPGGDA